MKHLSYFIVGIIGFLGVLAAIGGIFLGIVWFIEFAVNRWHGWAHTLGMCILYTGATAFGLFCVFGVGVACYSLGYRVIEGHNPPPPLGDGNE